MSAHSLLVKQLRCLACEIEDVTQPNKTEAHHLNLGSHAGQLRLGDGYQIPLCQWHHRSVRPYGMSTDAMTHLYGPSLKDARQFHFAYGSDESLLKITQHKLSQFVPESA